MPAANTLVNQTNITVLLNYTGLSLNTLTENLGPSFGEDYTSGNIAVTFSTVFGVLFCGVTGILAGANMSGKIFYLYTFFLLKLQYKYIYDIYFCFMLFYRQFEESFL